MTDAEAPLAGKVAYVTGAARGQGRSHCIRLARAGADVVAIDACAPVTDHNGYPPARQEDLAETVSLVEGDGARSSPTRSMSATPPGSSGWSPPRWSSSGASTSSSRTPAS